MRLPLTCTCTAIPGSAAPLMITGPAAIGPANNPTGSITSKEGVAVVVIPLLGATGVMLSVDVMRVIRVVVVTTDASVGKTVVVISVLGMSVVVAMVVTAMAAGVAVAVSVSLAPGATVVTAVGATVGATATAAGVDEVAVTVTAGGSTSGSAVNRAST